MNKTLLQILVDWLPNHGGWPGGLDKVAQDYTKYAFFYKAHVILKCGLSQWNAPSGVSSHQFHYIELPEVAKDWHKSIITKEQYEQAIKDLS